MTSPSEFARREEEGLPVSSGRVQVFETGSVRDDPTGKGRCDLLPALALLRLARVYERGAAKYGDRNWERGQPTGRLLDSGLRHLLRWMAGDADEDHLAMAVWNLAGAMEMEERVARGGLPTTLLTIPGCPGMNLDSPSTEGELPRG